METKLNLKIIESFGLPKAQWTPDYDDRGYTFTLPSGIKLNTFFVCNGEPTESDCLEGFDGWIYITTKEELEKLVKMSYEETLDWIEKNDDQFLREEFE